MNLVIVVNCLYLKRCVKCLVNCLVNCVFTKKVYKCLVNWFFKMSVFQNVFSGCSEAVKRRCSVEKLFLKISQNSGQTANCRAQPASLLKKWPWHRCFHRTSPKAASCCYRSIILKSFVFKNFILEICW